ncbi:MAG: universal stress protein [Alteromonas sp.]|nr:universal stress protein [Alteromonas sp.]MAY23159.1 universal stress protein [Flavobacteriaceae bacterium]|tara:strand:+ start:129452 stop:130297 length:846 start_codon:yes stop_codon:yes gene_type:complete
MESMQRILFPTDFSENSWNAIAYALHFFKGEKLQFHFLHLGISGMVENDKNLHPQGISVSNLLSKGAFQKLEELKEKIDNLYPHHEHTIHLHFESSLFIEGIRKYVKAHDIDLIIMGTKGASGIKEATLGSHAGAVITRVKCPTLVIPEKAAYQTPASVAFPTDFNILYKDKIIKTLKEFSSYHESSLKILRVVRKGSKLEDDQIKNRDFLSSSLQEVNHSFHWIQSPELEKGLQEFIDSMGVNIIAMVGKNLNFFQRLLFKPTIAKISYHTDIPFLVLHE